MIRCNWEKFRTRKYSKRIDLTEASGFTLIELLIVIIILGILAGITFVSVTNARTTAFEKSCKSDAVILRKALEQYYLDKGNYPVAAAAASKYTAAQLSILKTGTPQYLVTLPGISGTADSTKSYFLSVALGTLDLNFYPATITSITGYYDDIAVGTKPVSGCTV